MKTISLWKNVYFLLLCFFGSVGLSVLGFIILPTLLQYSKTHVDKQVMLLLCFFAVFLLYSIFFLGETSFQACALARRTFYQARPAYFKRIALFLIVALVIYLAVSLLSGLIAVAVQHIFSGIMTFEEHKLVIDLAVSLLTILIMPVIIAELLAFSLYNARFIKTITLGLSTLKTLYFKLLLIMMILFILGLLLALPAQLMEVGILKQLWMLLSYSVLGTAALIAIYHIGLGTIIEERGRRAC